MNHTQTGIHFFSAYKDFVTLANVARAGYGMWGVYGENYDKEAFFKDRRQSDLEHCAGISSIIRNMHIFYPAFGIDNENFWYYDLWGGIHELGENIIGDIPDNGTRDAAEKIRAETEYVFGHLSHYPSNYQRIGVDMFNQFNKHDTEFGRKAFLIDKLDAILLGFVYESEGKPGLFSKVRNPSTRDSEEHAITGVETLSDNWLCGMLLRQSDYEGIDIIVEICQSAAYLIRGKEMDWIEKIYHPI